MSTRYANGVALILASIAFAAGLYYYPSLPNPMVGHWNEAGQADAFVTPFWGVSLIPITMLCLTALLALIPLINPLHNNIDSFRREYNLMLLGLILFLSVIQTVILAANLGSTFSMVLIIMPALGALLFFLGLLLPMTKRNWFVGFRTPWTISSDTVWFQTHRVGGRTFQVLGLIALCSVLVPAYALPIFLGALLIGILGVFTYSYTYYRELST